LIHFYKRFRYFYFKLGWKRGEKLFSEHEPWVSVLTEEQRGSRCEGCYSKEGPDPEIACDNCGIQEYCSWKCRANDQSHQLECPFIAEKGSAPTKDVVRLMVRAILKLKAGFNKNMTSIVEGGGQGDWVPTVNKKRLFEDLLSHSDDFLKHQGKADHFRGIHAEVEEYLWDQTPDFEEFMEIIGRIYINGFEVCDDNMDTYGWAVYLGPSIMDHSCSPTAEVSFTGNRITVTLLRDVYDLSEVSISYCNSNQLTVARQEQLYNNYFFLCACCKCKGTAHGKGYSIPESNKKCSKGKKKKTNKNNNR